MISKRGLPHMQFNCYTLWQRLFWLQVLLQFFAPCHTNLLNHTHSMLLSTFHHVPTTQILRILFFHHVHKQYITHQEWIEGDNSLPKSAKGFWAFGPFSWAFGPKSGPTTVLWRALACEGLVLGLHGKDVRKGRCTCHHWQLEDNSSFIHRWELLSVSGFQWLPSPTCTG